MVKPEIDMTEFADAPLMPEGGEPFELVVDFSRSGYDLVSLRDGCALVLGLDEPAIEALGVDWDQLEAALEAGAQQNWRLAQDRGLPITLEELRADLRGWIWAALREVAYRDQKVGNADQEL